MKIRIKGDIVKQLNEIYPNILFRIKYKNELKERLIEFYNSLIKGSVSEILNFSKEYCLIEENEIKVFNEAFIDKYKTELFNSFNPIWYKEGVKKEKEKENGKKINEDEIGFETAKKRIKEYININEINYGILDNAYGICDIEHNMFLDTVRVINKDNLLIISEPIKNLISIDDIRDINEKIINEKNEKTKEYLNKIKETLEKRAETLNLFKIEVYLTKKTIMNKYYFETMNEKIRTIKQDEEQNYFIYINEDFKEILLEKRGRFGYNIINKKINKSEELEKEIVKKKKIRILINFIINKIKNELI